MKKRKTLTTAPVSEHGGVGELGVFFNRLVLKFLKTELAFICSFSMFTAYFCGLELCIH